MEWPVDRLTRFEVARLVGARSLQISLGAPILVKTELSNPIDVAKQEFRAKILPITVKRKLPNGEFQVIDLKKAVENWLKDYGEEI